LPAYVELRGALEWRFPTFRTEFAKHSIERNSEIALDLIATGRIKVDPLLTTTGRPEQAAELYAGIKTSPDDHVGVIFDWT
jgi:threonine dehydrogenase-like Zn-dependent dehydrogenase